MIAFSEGLQLFPVCDYMKYSFTSELSIGSPFDLAKTLDIISYLPVHPASYLTVSLSISEPGGKDCLCTHTHTHSYTQKHTNSGAELSVARRVSGGYVYFSILFISSNRDPAYPTGTTQKLPQH